MGETLCKEGSTLNEGDINMILNQLKRLFKHQNFLILLIYSLGLTFLQYQTFNRYQYPSDSSVFIRLIGFDYTGYGTVIFIFTFPIIVTLFGAALYQEDVNRKIILNQQVRSGRKRYYVSQYLSCFIGGAIAGVLPYLIHSLTFFMIYPMVVPDPLTSQIYYEYGAIYQLYFNDPWLLWVGYLVIVFLLSGVLACLGLAISYFLSVRYLEYLMPFVILFILTLFFQLFSFFELSPFFYLDLSNASSITQEGWMMVVLAFLTLLAASLVLLVVKIRSQATQVD